MITGLKSQFLRIYYARSIALYWHGLSVHIYTAESNVGLSDGYTFALALGFHIYVYGHGRIANACHLGVKTDGLSDQNGSMKYDFLYGNGDDTLRGDLTDRGGTGKIDIAEYDAAEYSAVLVRISRQQYYPNGWISWLSRCFFTGFVIASHAADLRDDLVQSRLSQT